VEKFPHKTGQHFSQDPPGNRAEFFFLVKFFSENHFHSMDEAVKEDHTLAG
jgi:hypothetical protein